MCENAKIERAYPSTFAEIVLVLGLVVLFILTLFLWSSLAIERIVPIILN